MKKSKVKRFKKYTYTNKLGNFKEQLNNFIENIR